MAVGSVKIGVVGAGSWGTALANLLGTKGYKLDLWVFEEEVKNQIKESRENKIFLPGIRLSQNISPSNNLEKVVSEKDLVLIAVPSHLMRETSVKMFPLLAGDTILVTASKGIENKTHLTMTGVLKETIADIDESRLVALSGPSFAREVGMNLPTLVTVASKNNETASFVQHVFATSLFRVYTNDDVMGVELGGAVKNVIAIAAGIIDGLEFGLNTRAALVTRGLTELRRLGIELGANPHTFAGLAGVGDLMLTCTGNLSRNYTLGKQIGQGKTLKEILADMRMVAEGVRTAKSVYNLSRKLDVEMPISHEVYHILYDNRTPAEALKRLMTRDLKKEIDDKV